MNLLFWLRKNPKPTVTAKDEPFLYVVLPYFNFCKFQRRKQLFLEFIERIRHEPRVRIVVHEAVIKGTEFQLPYGIEGVFLHLRNEIPHHIWIKEALINTAIRMLPTDWKFVAWVDADITFLNHNWVQETIEELQTNDVVQLYHTCVNMGPDNEAMKIDTSFMYMYKKSGKPYHPTAKYGFWHPGFAWGMNRKAFAAMDGLIDFGILGSGDRHMALALIGLVQHSHPGNIHESYKKKLLDYQDRVKGLQVGYVRGTIMHHWHGRLADRRYRERWDILTKGKYDPYIDIEKGITGLYHFTNNGLRLEPDIQEYFVGRKEDNMTV